MKGRPMNQPVKPAHLKTYDEIWLEFASNPHYKGLDTSELWRIHAKWRALGKRYGK